MRGSALDGDLPSRAESRDEAWRWAGDPCPVEIPGSERNLEQLATIKRQQRTSALFDAAADMVRRTRATVLVTARATVLNHIASDMAKGFAPSPAGQ